VRKRCGNLRLCIDYRRLNIKTYKDAFPLPRIEESLNALNGSRYYSTMDMTCGYNQVEVDEEDKHKTAFTTPWGLWEYERMPFGLCNAPATFQRLMQHCFREEVLEILLVFLDDLIVFSKTILEHVDRLDKVFTKLRNCRLKLKLAKCDFFKEEVKYLGHIVSEKGVSTDPKKVSAVVEWNTPKTMKELKSFLGLASYYRRFMKGFSQIAKPLYDQTRGYEKRKSQPLQWSTECDTAFKTLKEKLVTAPVLGYADFTKPFILETDASLIGLGAILSQQTEEGGCRVISYASRTLVEAERNMEKYSSMRLELLAMKWAITEKYKDYLMGSKFTVYTDNNPLCHLNTAKLGAVEQRWVAQLAMYNFEVKYKPVKKHTNVDALSRKTEQDIEEVQEILTRVAKTTPIPEEVLNQSSSESGIPVHLQEAGCVGSVIDSLPNLTNTEIQTLQESDPGIQRLKVFWDKGAKPTCNEIDIDKNIIEAVE
jgi:hypothetical protein